MDLLGDDGFVNDEFVGSMVKKRSSKGLGCFLSLSSFFYLSIQNIG
jgi:hypothetical protein